MSLLPFSKGRESCILRTIISYYGCRQWGALFRTKFRKLTVQHCLQSNQNKNLGHVDTTPMSVSISNANPITYCAGPNPVKWRPVATAWKCYFLLQMSFKCTETLTVACHRLKESQHTETVVCVGYYGIVNWKSQ